MDLIENNPYCCILGLLVGATTRKQNRQINRLKQYIEAQQDTPTDDFSFPTLGKLNKLRNSIAHDGKRFTNKNDIIDLIKIIENMRTK